MHNELVILLICVSLLLIETKSLYRSIVYICVMGDSSYGLNFDLGKKNEIQHHS